MPFQMSLSQASLAAAILASTAGTYVALSPPNPSVQTSPATGDSLRWLRLTSKHTTKFSMAPCGFLALHTCALVLLHPKIPSSIIRHGAENGLNPNVITWSPATAIPLALMLCAGIPLRLHSYASLGKNFTFALAEPDHLKTDGIYHYVQHPSYTALVVLLLSNIALLGRLDGALSCWPPPRWYSLFRTLALALAPVGLAVLVTGVWTRVRQEERMLRAAFTTEWEQWHANTSRFIPWLF